MAKRNNDEVTIDITLKKDHDLDGGKKGLRAGRFEAPDPLVNVTPGTFVHWEIKPANYDFTVTFHNVSPFLSGDLVINKVPGTGTSAFQQAKGSGHYHYSVSATDNTGTTYVISSCPELDVGGVS